MSKCELCGSEVKAKNRSYPYHKKLFVLFQIGYENWEPVEKKGANIGKSKDVFRKQIMVMAGHYESYYGLDGGVIFEPLSLKFSKMGVVKFDEVYRDCLHVIAERVLFCGKDELHDEIMTRF